MKDESIIKEALEKLEQSENDISDNRKYYYDDMCFARLGEQWPEEQLRQRMQDARPALTINRLPSFIRQVVNDARQSRPSVDVRPVDNVADEDTADVISGLIRSIERRSRAWVAYDTAIDHAVSGGFGFFRLEIDYENSQSFDKEVKIKRVANPLMINWDTSTTEFDSSDWNYAFVSDSISKEDFKKKYPDKEESSINISSRDGYGFYETQEDQLRIAEYWERKDETVKLLQVEDLQSGVTFSVFEKDFKENIDQQFMVEIGSLRVLNQRETTISNVTRRIISGSEILQEDSWPGSYIPIIPVWGEEIFIKGKRQFRSLIRDVKDSQRMFNYWRSASTELVALAPKAPFIVAKNSIAPEDREKWATANNRSYSMLEYLADRGPMPQRQQFASVPSGAFQEALSAADDMKAITGIYDAALGARSNETSGRAILARQREADNSNFHFLDNLSRAIEWEGKLLVEIIPSVYGARQAVKILGEDQASKVVALTQGAPKGKLYNISTGVYDVEVKTGPSYTTKREETREFLIEIMRSVPNSAPLLGDVLMEHLDFIGNDRLAKRLKSLLPPEIKQAEEQEALESAEIPPEVQASLQYSQKQIQEQQQILQNMQAQLQQAMQEKEQLEKRIVSESDQKEINKAMSDLKSYQERLRTEEQGILSAKKELMLQEDIVKKSIQAEMLKYERDMASLKTEEEKQNNAQILATLNEVLMSVQRMTTQNKISDNLIAIEN